MPDPQCEHADPACGPCERGEELRDVALEYFRGANLKRIWQLGARRAVDLKLLAKRERKRRK